MPLLRLDNVSLHFGTRDLLKSVDLTLHKNQKIGLLGRNGEGKTTLLKKSVCSVAMVRAKPPC